jgi:hypothetical protein
MLDWIGWLEDLAGVLYLTIWLWSDPHGCIEEEDS